MVGSHTWLGSMCRISALWTSHAFRMLQRTLHVAFLKTAAAFMQQNTTTSVGFMAAVARRPWCWNWSRMDRWQWPLRYSSCSLFPNCYSCTCILCSILLCQCSLEFMFSLTCIVQNCCPSIVLAQTQVLCHPEIKFNSLENTFSKFKLNLLHKLRFEETFLLLKILFSKRILRINLRGKRDSGYKRAVWNFHMFT